ncbi:MAG: hypothetical protein KGM16_08835 [Bacteroidota bacterium]|nr:hypothetical protein [Bacteroidota bacterium]
MKKKHRDGHTQNMEKGMKLSVPQERFVLPGKQKIILWITKRSYETNADRFLVFNRQMFLRNIPQNDCCTLHKSPSA